MADTTPQYTFPLIHLNGNSRESLMRDYSNARDRLKEAMEAYCKIDFHARNYYPLADGSFVHAQADHQEHLRKLVEVHEYLSAHVTHLIMS